MKKFWMYYQALKMRQNLAEKSLALFMLMAILTVALGNLILSGFDSATVMGPSFILLVIILAFSTSQSEALNHPDILLSLPFTARERVRYYYWHIGFSFILALLIFSGIIYLGLGLLLLLDSASVTPGEEGIIHISGDLYSVAITLVQLALYSVIGFFSGVKKRLIVLTIMLLTLTLFHVLALYLLTGQWGIFDAYEVLDSRGNILGTSILTGLSVGLVYLSFRYSLWRHQYKTSF